jgi:phosphonate metabolism protein PhnN/1,5-bisphosphokinase (PRPP-forming)
MKKIYKGTLFLVVGNSGSGKDSIIKGAFDKYPSNLKKLITPKRYITRQPSETEDNIMISPEKFKEMSSNGAFALEWYIYDLYYGIPIEIDDHLRKGHPVVVNVSRTVVKKARKIYHNIRVIFIKVPFEITLNRIKERERERNERLKERIERARNNQTFSDADFIVDNSGKLENAIDDFLNFLIKVLENKNK